MAGAISEDVALAARSTATVVILMGLNKLEEIMTIFSSHGKSETPVAVVQNGTTKNQKTVVGKVSDMARLARQENIGSPAVIIIGEVVKYSSFVEALAFRAQHQVSTFQ